MAFTPRQIAASIDTSVLCAVLNLGITEGDLLHCFRALMSREMRHMATQTTDSVESLSDASDSEESDSESVALEAPEAPEEAVAIDYEGMQRPQLLDLVRTRGLQAKFNNAYAGRDPVKRGLGFAQLNKVHYIELLTDDDASREAT